MEKRGLLIIFLAGIFLISFSSAATLSSCGTISSPGEYVLNQSLQANGDCLNISSNNVVVDLNGFNITGNITGTGISSIAYNHSIIRNGTISNFSIGLNLSSSSNNTLTNNIIIGSSREFLDGEGYGIYLSSSSNNTITNNIITDTHNDFRGGGNGIYLSSSSNNTIINNTVNSNMGSGIYLSSSSNNNTIQNNTVNSNRGSGIYLSSSSNNTITNNTANSNMQSGIYSEYYSNYTEIINNTANSNSQYGIEIASNSWYNKIIHNTANSNSLSGISVHHYSYYTELTNNIANFNLENGFFLNRAPNNTFIGNIADKNIQHGIDFVSTNSQDNNYINFSFNHNLRFSILNSSLLDEDIERVYPKDSETSLQFYVSHINGTDCSDYEYNLSFYPNINYTADNNSNILTVNFTPEKEGIYTLNLDVSVGNNNHEVRNIRFLVGNASSGSKRYYMYEENPIHGQPASSGSDTGSMFSNPPADEQYLTCGTWIQYSPDEIVNLYPIIKNISLGWFYSSDGNGNSLIERYATFSDDRDYNIFLPSTGSSYPSRIYKFETSNFTNLNLTSDYAQRFYWLSFKMKMSQPAIISNATQQSYADIEYLYAGPKIEKFSEVPGSDIRDIRLLSSFWNDENKTNATLEFEGEGSFNLVLNFSTGVGEFYYDGLNCSSHPKCTLNSNSGGISNLTLELGSYHYLDVIVSEEVEVVVPTEEVSEIPSSSSSVVSCPIYVVREDSLINGSSRNLGNCHGFNFKIYNETHKIILNSLNYSNQSVNISVFSEEKVLSLFVNGSEKIDFDNDGFYDFYIELRKVTSLRAEIFVKKINEEIVANSTEEVIGEEREDFGGISDESKKKEYFRVIVGIFLGLVFLFLLIFFIRRIRKNLRNKI